MLIGGKTLLIDAVRIAFAISLGVVVSVLAITMPWRVRAAPKIDALHSQ